MEGLLSTGLPCLVWKETLHYEYCVTILRLLNAYILGFVHKNRFTSVLLVPLVFVYLCDIHVPRDIDSGQTSNTKQNDNKYFYQ